MKDIRTATVILGAVAALTFANASTASAADSFSFSFNTGAVAFAYSDGYWDRDHHWHNWRNAREHREYVKQNRGHYEAVRHTRANNKGWRGDQDHDGVPNGVDRDRDGDGVANRQDLAPDNRRRD